MQSRNSNKTYWGGSLAPIDFQLHHKILSDQYINLQWQLSIELYKPSGRYEKIRCIMFFGARIITLRLQLISPNLSIDLNSPEMQQKIHKLNSIMDTHPNLLLNSESLFIDFALLAYEHEPPLFKLCIANGARLSHNTFFLNILNTLKQYPQHAHLAQLIDLFVMDPNPPPQPWYSPAPILHKYAGVQQVAQVDVAPQEVNINFMERMWQEEAVCKQTERAWQEEARKQEEMARQEQTAQKQAEIARQEEVARKQAEIAQQEEVARKQTEIARQEKIARKQAKVARREEIAREEEERQKQAEILRLEKMAQLKATRRQEILALQEKEMLKQAEIARQKEKSAKQPIVRVLGPKELAQKAIKELNAQEINKLLSENNKLSKYVTEITITQLQNNTDDRSVEFLQNVQVSDADLVLLATNLKQIKQVFAIIDRILNFKDQLYYSFATKLRFEILVKDLLNDNHIVFENHPLYIKVVRKHEQANTWAREAARPLFDKIAAAQSNQGVDFSEMPYLVNSVDLEHKTPLMLALDKNLSKRSLSEIIEKSNHSILFVDDNGWNVFHHWANSVDQKSKDSITKSKEILKLLWLKFKEQALLTGDVKTKLNQQTKQDGDSFIHTLLKRNTPEIALALLSEMYSIEDSTSQFAPLILLKNTSGKTAIDLLEEQDVFNESASKLLYDKIIEMVFTLCIQHWNEYKIYFPAHTCFFNYNPDNILTKLLKSSDYKKLITIIECRNRFRYGLNVKANELALSAPTKNVRKAVEELTGRLNIFFGVNEYGILLSKIYGNEEGSDHPMREESILGAINEHINITDNEEIAELCNTPLFRETEKIMPLPETLAWKTLKRYISGHSNEKIDSEIYDICINLIKSRVNYANDRGNKTALEYAIAENNLELVKILHSRCGATITDKIVVISVFQAHGNNDLSIADYLFVNSAMSRDHSRRKSCSAFLCEQAALFLRNPNIILWLARNDFTILSVTADGLNVLQKLLITAQDQHIDLLLSLMQALFTKKSEVAELFNNKGKFPRDYSSLYCIFEARLQGLLNKDNSYRAFELCLQNGASIVDIGVKHDRNALHNVLCFRDSKLMELFFRYTSDRDLLKMLTAKDYTGESIEQIIYATKPNNLIDQEMTKLIKAKLESMKSKNVVTTTQLRNII